MLQKRVFIQTFSFAIIFSMFCKTFGANDSLFEDNFTSGAGWISAYYPKNFSDAVENGKYCVQASQTEEAFLRHSLKPLQKYDNFSYTLTATKLSEKAQGIGLLFCLQSDLQCYIFYTYANQQYVLGKYVLEGNMFNYKEIATGINSFIATGENEYKISKSGDEISLFCNTVFLEKISDQQYKSGDIGLYIGTNEKSSFQVARYSNGTIQGKSKTYFSDTFEDGILKGWKRLMGNGIEKEEKGVLTIEAKDTLHLLFTNGNYRDKPCTTIVSNLSDDKSKFYGISYLQVKPGESTKSYTYLINGNKFYGVANQSGTITPKSSTSIHGTIDTLVVSANYSFYVNGQLVDESIQTGLDFNAIALIVYPNSTVSFDNFRAGIPEGTSHIIQSPYNFTTFNKKSSFRYTGPGIIIDIKGRHVATYTTDYHGVLQTLSTGTYYIIQRSKEHPFIKHMVIHIK